MASIKKNEGKRGVSYKITVSMGLDAFGNQIRRYMTWKPEKGMSAKQAEKQAKLIAFEFEKSLSKGFYPQKEQTFAEYADYVFSLRVQRGDKPQTLARISRQTELINRYIGNLKLSDIRPQHLNEMYRKLAQPGSNKCGIYAIPKADFKTIMGEVSLKEFSERCNVSCTVIKKLLHKDRISLKNAEKIEKSLKMKSLFSISGADKAMSPGTIRSYHGVVSSVFSNAEREMLIQYNPAARATLPKMKAVRDQSSLQPEDIDKILAALDSERIDFKAMIYLFLATGCRRGEILSLTWDKVDLKNNEILINRSISYLPKNGIFFDSTKTGNERKIAIPQETSDLLKKYKAWQSEKRILLGDLWKDENLVFTRWDGSPQYPSAINSWLIEFCKRHDLKPLHPHLFRHTTASILLSNGTDVLTVSKMLGHSNPSMTMRVYAHEIEESRKKTAECISENIFKRKTS